MNRQILKLLAVSFLSLSHAWSSSDQAALCCDDEIDCAFSTDIEAAAFFPLGSTMRRIYGTALPQFTAAENWRFHRHWAAWLDVSYVFGNGHSIGETHASTHLNLVPISAGIKYVHRVSDCTDFYVGLGPCYSFLDTTDHSSHVRKHTSASNFGAVAKSGFVYHLNSRWFVQGFFNYMYQKVYFHQTDSSPFVYRYNANLSSLQLGGGIGINY